MVSSNDFKTGMTIEKDGEIFSIIEFMHVKPGKGSAFVRTKLRNLRNGAVIDFTFNAGVKVATAMIDKVEMQYIYAEGDNYVFMNTETYDQIEINAIQLQTEKNFLTEGMMVNVMFYRPQSGGEEVLGVILPDKVVLEVTEAAPAVKGDTKTNATKDCVLETGYQLKCPMFIEAGEKIIVSTLTGEYVSRNK